MLGGGLTPSGKPAPWVLPRLEAAIRCSGGDPIVCLSAGTVHKLPPKDQDGFPITEAACSAAYLIERGVNPTSVWQENCSFDTIGNAYFSRVIHIEPANLKTLHIITSDFHMARTTQTFDWVYGLEPNIDVTLTYQSVSAVGMSRATLLARQEKEADAFLRIEELRRRIVSVYDLHQFIYTEHSAYNSERTPRGTIGSARDSY